MQDLMPTMAKGVRVFRPGKEPEMRKVEINEHVSAEDEPGMLDYEEVQNDDDNDIEVCKFLFLFVD